MNRRLDHPLTVEKPTSKPNKTQSGTGFRYLSRNAKRSAIVSERTITTRTVDARLA